MLLLGYFDGNGDDCGGQDGLTMAVAMATSAEPKGLVRPPALSRQTLPTMFEVLDTQKHQNDGF